MMGSRFFFVPVSFTCILERFRFFYKLLFLPAIFVSSMTGYFPGVQQA